MKGILVFFHCVANTGYAIAPLERVFYRMAQELVPSGNIHFAYPRFKGEHPAFLPVGFPNVIELDATWTDWTRLATLSEYIRKHNIEIAFGFDQPLRRPVYKALRQGGVRRIISYWGAPMGSINPLWKRILKRIDVELAAHRPDHFILESQAMARTATHGRCIPASDVSVVYLGVDAERFRPAPQPSFYAHDVFGIPHSQKIVYFSGHMEQRKGVHVIVQAAVELVAHRGRSDVHFVILGNRNGEEQRFAALYQDTAAARAIVFGGYRTDVERIVPSCYVGTIASTGWDSFTMSSLEIAASGLPLVVSDLQGLRETVAPDETGYVFPPGDYVALADRLEVLLDDVPLRTRMGNAARARVLAGFTIDKQIASLARIVRGVSDRR